MPETSGHHPEQSTRDAQPKERTHTPVSQPEGIAVERWGNPDVLPLVRNDPTIVVEEGEVLFKEGVTRLGQCSGTPDLRGFEPVLMR